MAISFLVVLFAIVGVGVVIALALIATFSSSNRDNGKPKGFK